MPFPFIPTSLGICFFLVWLLIGGIIFRDGQLAAQRERELNGLMGTGASRNRRRTAA